MAARQISPTVMAHIRRITAADQVVGFVVHMVVILLIIGHRQLHSIYRLNSAFGKPKRVAAQQPASTDLHRPLLESVRPERTDPNGWIVHRPDSPTTGKGKDDHLYYFPTSPILGNWSLKVEMALQGRSTTMLMDTGADNLSTAT